MYPNLLGNLDQVQLLASVHPHLAHQTKEDVRKRLRRGGLR